MSKFMGISYEIISMLYMYVCWLQCNSSDHKSVICSRTILKMTDLLVNICRKCVKGGVWAVFSQFCHLMWLTCHFHLFICYYYFFLLSIEILEASLFPVYSHKLSQSGLVLNIICHDYCSYYICLYRHV